MEAENGIDDAIDGCDDIELLCSLESPFVGFVSASFGFGYLKEA